MKPSHLREQRFASNETIPLFDQRHSFIPTKPRIAVARSASQGWSQTGGTALPLTGASTMAGWPSITKRATLAIAILALFLPLDGSSAAHRTSFSRHEISRSFADRVAAYVAEAEHRFDLPASWIYAVMNVESAGQRRAVSPKGAMGLMQIMPKTWHELRTRYHFGTDPFATRDNILAGAAYLRELHDRYGSPGDLAAYNAGPERYEDYRDRNRPLPTETKAYVAKLAPVVGARALPDTRPADPITQIFAAAATLFVGHTIAQPLVAQPTSHFPASAQQKRVLSRRPITDLTAITPRSTGLFVRLSSMDETQ